MEITGATNINVSRNTSLVTINGTAEAIEDCKQWIFRIHEYGSAIMNNPYQERFEARLRFQLQSKYGIISIDSLGVVVNARDLHLKLCESMQTVKKIYDDATTSFIKVLKNRLNAQWDVWLARKAVKKNVLEWLSVETGSDAEDVYARVAAYFDANDCSSFEVMVAAVLRAMVNQAQSLSAQNSLLINYCKQKVAAAAERTKDDCEDSEQDNLFAIVISKENIRGFILEFARIFPSLYSLLTFGFDRPSILDSVDAHFGNVSSDMELMAIDAFKRTVSSLAIPEDVLTSMRKLLVKFRSEISVQIEANKDIKCDINSQFNDGNTITIFNQIFWQLDVKVKYKNVSISSHGSDGFSDKRPIQALSCVLISPADRTVDVFSTDDNEMFQEHLLNLTDGFSMILIFQNVSAQSPMPLDPRTVEICREICGATATPNEIGAKSSQLCFAVKGVVVSKENTKCRKEISHPNHIHLYIMNKELFRGLAGLHVLYYSMVTYLSTIYSYSCPEDFLNTNSKLNATISTAIEALPVVDLSKSADVHMLFNNVFCAMSSVESAVLKKLKIPSFDSLNWGSFVSYFTKDSSIDFIRRLLNRLFGDDENLLISLKGSSSDTSAVERDSPRGRVSSADDFHPVPSVDLDGIFGDLCNIIEELNAMQQEPPSTLLSLFLILQKIERSLLDTYQESGRGNNIGFVGCTSLTFIQFIVSQFDQFPANIFEQFAAICFPTTSSSEITPMESQDEKCSDYFVDDLQASLLVDCVRWFGRNNKRASSPDPESVSDIASIAVALLSRVTLKETGSVGDHRAEAYTSFIHQSEEVLATAASFHGHHSDGLLVYCPRQSLSELDQHADGTSTFDDSAFIDRVIAKLKKVPFGVRCSVGVNWQLLTRHLDTSKPVPDIPVLLKAHEEALANSNRKFMIISCDDAIPIPDSLATTEEIGSAVKSHDVHLLASWFLLAAMLDDYARMQFINNCVAALRQVFSPIQKEGDEHTAGLVYQLGIDVACALPDYLGSLVLTPWIKHIVTKYSSGIQVETAADDFCQYVISLPLNQRILTIASVSALLVSSSADSMLSRLEDFFLRTDPMIIGSQKSSKYTERLASNPSSDASKIHTEACTDGRDTSGEDSNLPTTVVSSSSAIGSMEEDFDETNPELCKKLISKIFHSADVQDSFKGNLKESLKLLTKMNSRDVHFVLEVIQNAADSTYPENVNPTLLIQLHHKKIVVKTNEVGFSRANVKAITGVGMSHKKNIAGYIGHKGIGFKTVFVVTDQPQIHSKGFHFQFDTLKGSHLAPYWIEDTGTSWFDSYDSNYRTSIVLPLNKKALMSFPKLKENLYLAFDKNLLLFLGKLSVMTFEDFTVSEGKVTTFRRVPLTDHWLLCEHEDVSVDFWYIKRKRFSPSVPKSTDDADEDGDIAETEIAVAFNFHEDSSFKVEEGTRDNLSMPSNREEDFTEVVIESNPLRLMVSKDSMPIYSFLPTKTAAFKFIVQADFVLATNRESVVEQDPYNQQLIQQLINLITEIFQEFALFLQFQSDLVSGSGPNSCPALSQLCEIYDKHKLVITPQAVIALIPRPYSCSIHKEIQNLSQQVCYNLRNCHIFLSAGGVLCDAATLVVTQVYPDVVTEFLPENILFRLIGKRFPHPSLVLDEDLVAHFDICYLHAAQIVDCLEVAVSETGPYVEAVERINVVSRLLVVLVVLTTEELPNSFSRFSATASATATTTGASKRSNVTRNNLGPVPSAVTKKQLQQQVQSAGANLPKTRQLSLDLLNRLKKLPIWPLTSGIFASSAARTLFLQSNDDLPKMVSSYMAQYLSQFIHIVDETLFDSADTISRNFGALLKGFVAANFKSTVGHFGLHSLTSTMLLSNVLVPALTNREQSPTVDQACALLACTYLCSDKSRSLVDDFQHAGVWIPAVGVQESNDKKYKGNKNWNTDSDHVVYVSTVREAKDENAANSIDREVHFGPEFSYSATSRLLITLMKQIGWKYVHPKLYCLIYDIAFRDGFDNAKYKNELFNTISAKLSSDAGVTNLKTFLKKAGVINFFKGYKSNNSTGSVGIAPSLSNVLSRLLANSVPVCVRDQLLRKQPALFLFQSHRAQISSVSTESSAYEGDEKLITYTENQNIYDHLKADLLDLIAAELRDVIPREKQMVEQLVKELLNRYPCIPVKVYDLQHPITSGKCLLASVDAAVIPDNQSSYWPHFAYVDAQQNPSLRTLFETIGVRKIPSFKTIAFPELVNIFSWMSTQPQVVASVEMMRDFYYRVQSVLSDAQQLVEFEAEVGRLRDLFSSDAPVFWFPSSYKIREGSTDRKRDVLMTSGKMYRQSEVVLYGISDVSQQVRLLAFPGCPIRVLSNHYDEEIVGFFRREKYCDYCKLVEGFYCYRGQAIREAIRCNSTVTLRCSCRGSKMEQLSASKKGILRINVTAHDLVLVLKAVRKKLEEGNSTTEEDLLVEEALEDETFSKQFTTEQYQFILKSCFESLNRALHKCFTQEDGLFPYVPEDVRALKDMLGSEDFWPSSRKDSPCWLSFKDASSMVTLAVESSDVFTPFSDLLTEYSANIRVLDLTFNSKIDGFPIIEFAPSESSLPLSQTSTSSSLDSFEHRYANFLQQEKYVIDQKCHMKPLRHLSHYPLLLTDLLPKTVRVSKIISTRLCHHRDNVTVTSTASASASFRQQHIIRLFVTLAFLERDFKEVFDSLMGDGGFYKFVRSKITLVDQLYEQSTLDLGKALSVINVSEGYVISSDRPLKYHVDSTSDLGSLKLFLHTSLSKKELKKIGMDFTAAYFLEPHVRRRLAQVKLTAFEDLVELLRDMDNVPLENLWGELREYGYRLEEETIAMIIRNSEAGVESIIDSDVAEDTGDVKFEGAELYLEAYLKLQDSVQNSKREARKHFAPVHDLLTSFPDSNVVSCSSATSRVNVVVPLEQAADEKAGSKKGAISSDASQPAVAVSTESDSVIVGKLNPLQRGDEYADSASVTKTPTNTDSSPRGGGGGEDDDRDAHHSRIESSSVSNSDGALQSATGPSCDEIATPSFWPPSAITYTAVNITQSDQAPGCSSEYIHRNVEVPSNYLSQKPPVRGVEILDINIDSALNSYITEHAVLSEDESRLLDASTAANIMHGKMGECIAEKILVSRFPNCAVEWMNRDSESAQPFDFLIRDLSGQITRFVEVKTRVSPEPVSHWFISRNELIFAAEQHTRADCNYSCMFIHLVESHRGGVAAGESAASRMKSFTQVSAFWVDELMVAGSSDDTGVHFSVQVFSNSNAGRS